MSIVDYSVLKNEDHGTEPPFKSDESGLHGKSAFPCRLSNLTNQGCMGKLISQ